jgi:hypothetical protein
MNRSLPLFITFTLIGHALAAQATEDDEKRILAMQLTQTLNVQTLAEESLALLPLPGDAGDIARKILAGDGTFRSTYAQELARIYQQKFSKEELREFVKFFQSAAGQKWVLRSSEIMKEQFAVLQQGEGPLLIISEIGCATSLLEPIFAEAKKKAGISESGVPAELVDRAKPLIEQARGLCGCIVQRAFKKWGVGAAANEQFEAFAQDLIEKGVCPMPDLTNVE